MRRIYLDHHATTPVDPRVLDAMLPFFRETFGNAASRQHAFGREAAEAVERARRQVAALLGARDEQEIVFTSGATESDNLAVKGVAAAWPGRRIVTVATEHPAVMESARAAEAAGAKLTVLPVGPDGLLDLDRAAEAIGPDTILVSVMAANNEIGVLQDLAALGRLCRERGVLFHTDAAQAAGKIALDVEAVGVDLLSMSAHKLYGPKGVGVLFARKRHPTLRRVRLTPQMSGGGHEQGLRSGTLNVPGIVGLGAACDIAAREMPAESARLRELRDRLWSALRSSLDLVHLNGHAERRLPGNLNVTFEHVEGEGLIAALDGIAVSSGAACASALLKPSHVLAAIGLPEHLLFRTIRFGLGRSTTREEIDETAARVIEAVRRLRAASPLYGTASRGGGEPPGPVH